MIQPDEANTHHGVPAKAAADMLARREAEKQKVIASGNAQAVRRRLDEIEASRTENLNRWAWELLQNARDAAGAAGKLSVRVSFDGTKLTFRHDGPAFRDDEIAHLIFHGSTKRVGIGRFGTGFISTHLLSRVVTIQGPLHDGTVFKFDLDRRGNDAAALQQSMDNSWEAMKASLREGDTRGTDRYTSFTYSIGRDTEPVVRSGLKELRRVAPLILAFNPQFSSLSIQEDGEPVVYRVREREKPNGDLYELDIVDGSGREISTVIVSKRESVQVAIAVGCDDKPDLVLPGPKMSRLYVAFPLMKTDSFPFRAAVNSELFHPRTERDGIYLETDESPKSAENRPRFEHACDAFGPLMEHAARSGVSKLPELLVLTPPANLESVDVGWLKETIRTRVVKDLGDRPVFTTCGPKVISPRGAIIPFADAGKRHPLWKLCASLNDLKEFLPPESDVDIWNEVVASWSEFTGEPPERANEVRTLEDIVCFTAERKTVSALSEQVEGDVWAWLSLLLDAMRDQESLELAVKYAILPDQTGNLRKASDLFLDGGIQADLKVLAEEAGLPGRAGLLATQLSKSCYATKLKAQSQEDLLEAVVDAIGDVEEDQRAVAVRLFGLVANLKLDDWLERISVITAGEELHTTKVRLGASPRERLLMPIARWGDAKEFGELFPAEFVLHGDYATALDDEDWKWLSERKAVIASPIVTDSTEVEDFVTMMRKEPGQREVVRSKGKVLRSYIAYLVGELSVLERIRNSRRSGVLLLRFLMTFVVPNDTSAFSELDVECEDGEPRKCYRAAWIAQLLGRGWVKGEKRTSYLTVQSLTELLSDQPDVIKALLDDKYASLLRSLDLSAADLALRSIGKTDTDRMSLIRSLGIIADAVGSDPALVARFAATIQTDQGLRQYIEQRGTFIERIRRNQAFGFSVEQEFRAVFGDDLDVSITRTGLSHDFALSLIPGEEDDGGRLEVATPNRQAFVELKATRDSDAVHMSVRQVEAATEMPDRYWLCVVAIAEGDVTSELVRVNARFVCDIGVRLKEAWSQYEALQNATPKSAAPEGETAIEVTGQEVRFRISRKLWVGGLAFEDAMKLLKPGTTVSSPVAKVAPDEGDDAVATLAPAEPETPEAQAEQF
jgi:hypothetical protein